MFATLWRPTVAAVDDAGAAPAVRRRATCALEASTTPEFADAVRALEHELVGQLRIASAGVFSDFRDEYDVMFRSACDAPPDGAEVALRMECASTPSVPGGVDSVDVEASPEFVEVTPGRVTVLWSVAPVDAEAAAARGFRAPVALRANGAIGLAKRLRRRLDDAIARLESDDADVADIDAAEAEVRALAPASREAAPAARRKEGARESGSDARR